MKFGSFRNTAVAVTALVIGLGFNSASIAKDANFSANPDIKVLYLTSDIYQGYISGFECNDLSIVENPELCTTGIKNIKWTYHGDVYAPSVKDHGEADGVEDLVGTVTGHPSFDVSFFGLGQRDENGYPTWEGLPATMPWMCDDCTLTINETTFERIDSIPMTGRAFVGLGMVPNAEGLMGMRMGGCAGLQAVEGDTGPYANMQGTICVNGTIEFDEQFGGKGSSNCVVVLQNKP